MTSDFSFALSIILFVVFMMLYGWLIFIQDNPLKDRKQRMLRETEAKCRAQKRAAKSSSKEPSDDGRILERINHVEECLLIHQMITDASNQMDMIAEREHQRELE